jgi:hypothetical protein
VVAIGLGAIGVRAVFAQDATPPVVGRGSMMQNGASGYLQTFMETAFAEKLGLNVDDVNARLIAGETMYDIALSAGVTAEEFPALMTEVRANAVDAAVKANVITQAQADLMNSRSAGQGGMMNGAGYDGDCPVQDGANLYGTRGGPGRMGNGQTRGGMMNSGWQTNP